MSIIVREREQERFIIEDFIVPYSNIKITNVNDNKPPLKIVLKKAVIWMILVAMLASLMFF